MPAAATVQAAAIVAANANTEAVILLGIAKSPGAVVLLALRNGASVSP
jgi:hypothetical protein